MSCDSLITVTVNNQIMFVNFAALFNCTPVDRVSDSMMAWILAGLDQVSCLLASWTYFINDIA